MLVCEGGSKKGPAAGILGRKAPVRRLQVAE
jgi:hypothetical protein